MKEIIIKFIGFDSWSRTIYRSADGTIYKDTDNRASNPCHRTAHECICTVTDQGEPFGPLPQDVTIIFDPCRVLRGACYENGTAAKTGAYNVCENM